MRNLNTHIRLHSRRRRQAAFSLTELVVAIGLLVLMLSLAGQVMSLTVRSTGQANALTEVNQLLRSLEQNLRNDLRHVERGRSILLIQGNPINTYWTQAQKEALPSGSGPAEFPPPWKNSDYADPIDAAKMVKPRADILMFFTSRRATSYVDPAVAAPMQQVVYAHAELGDYIYDAAQATYVYQPMVPAADMFPSQPAQLARVPAETWHLARRSVLLIPNPAPPVPAPPKLPWENWDPDPDTIDRFRLNSPNILLGAMDIVANFDFEYQLLVANPNSPCGAAPLFWPHIFDPTSDGAWGKPFERSKLDISPPPKFASRLGHYFLPHCASFKVEWALDSKGEFVGSRLDGEDEVFWFDQGAERNPGRPAEEPAVLGSLQKAIKDQERKPNGDQQPRYQRLTELIDANLGGKGTNDPYSLYRRFASPDQDFRVVAYGASNRTHTVVFTATRGANSGGPIADEVFPAALRITVDMFDKSRRLDRPIRHVMVIPVGQ